MMFSYFARFLVFALVLSGCGVFQDAAVPIEDSKPITAEATPVPAQFGCWDKESGIQSLSYDKGCTEDSDCTVVVLVRDCCGSQAALGVPKWQRDRVERWSRRCPGKKCACPAGDTQTDAAPVLAGSIEVGCFEGRCASFPRGTPPTGP
ncbi:MAG: hypothetical protein VX938_01105 [Myxococcota bacterium]|nr:hypothetical protein [Myxococcota bacterium]